MEKGREQWKWIDFKNLVQVWSLISTGKIGRLDPGESWYFLLDSKADFPLLPRLIHYEMSINFC